MLKLTNELVLKYDSLVASIVNKYAQNYNREDLYQVGRKALKIASEKYDPSMNTKFSTFSYKYILGEILEYLRKDKNIHISREILNLSRKVKIATETFYINMGKNPSSIELSKILNEPEEKIIEVLNLNQNTESLELRTEYDEGETTLYDKVAIEEKIDKIDLISLKDALNELSPIDRKLIYERYYEDKTQTELAREMNVSQVRVYRMERKILDDLYDKIA